jgi:hypothetical protein
MDSHHVDTEIHQNISYSLPDGRIGELLKLLKSYTDGQKDLEIEIYVKQQIKILMEHIQEVQYAQNAMMSRVQLVTWGFTDIGSTLSGR